MATLATANAEDFKTRYPAFEGEDDTRIEALIEEARGSVDARWIEADQVPALLAYTAHLLVTSGQLASGTAEEQQVAMGLIASMRAGDHEIKYANAGSASGGGASSGSIFGATPYGRLYLQLARRSFPPVMVV